MSTDEEMTRGLEIQSLKDETQICPQCKRLAYYWDGRAKIWMCAHHQSCGMYSKEFTPNICSKCGKHLSEAERKSVHTCFDRRKQRGDSSRFGRGIE